MPTANCPATSPTTTPESTAYRNPSGAEIDQAGGTALVVEADITDRTQAEAAVQQTVERFGRLDTLVNNAGLMLLAPSSVRTPRSGTA